MKDLIYALRCTSNCEPGKYKCRGGQCRYHLLEELPEEYSKLADFEENGKYFCNSCDYDRISQEAADKLEEYANNEDDGK